LRGEETELSLKGRERATEWSFSMRSKRRRGGAFLSPKGLRRAKLDAMRNRLIAVAWLLLAVATPAANAASVEEPAKALKWETSRIRVQAEIGQERVTVAYPFVNVSNRPVAIVDTKASCGCTVPTPEKDVIEPGGSSEIQAVFEIGDRKGKQIKRINVYTDEPGPKPWHELVLEVDIPEAVHIEPRVRLWRKGGDPEPQTYRVTIHEDLPMEIRSAAPREGSEAAPFDIDVETVVPNREYLVRLTPRDTSSPTRQVIVLSGDQDRQSLLSSYPLYAFIR